MKKRLWLVWSMALALFASCSTISSLQYDSLQPAEFSFPESVKRVGVVNNMPRIIADEASMSRTAGLLEGDGKVVAEALAEEIAATEYFDEVVICDSSLCELTLSLKGHQSLRDDWRGNVLSRSQVREWTDKLGVDMLFSVERVRIEVKKSANMSNLLYPPTIDGIISVVMRAYVPNRDTSMLTVTRKDTIFWESGPELTFTQIVKESSGYVAQMLVPYLIPSWKEDIRFYFEGGNVDMRDAGFYVREHDWSEAYPLWKKLYDNKKGKQKMRAAFNLALYHEMQGEFETATTYLNEAANLAKPETFEAALIASYRSQLAERMTEYQRLRLQMQRFEDK